MILVFKRVLSRLADLLDPDERDAVIGDIEELKVKPLRAIWELCGLIARRQASLWKTWRPWLAHLGIGGLIGVGLTLMAELLLGDVWRYLRTYRVYGVFYESGLTPSEVVIFWLSLALAIIFWSWIAGFAFTLISRKTAFCASILLCILWLGWDSALLCFVWKVQFGFLLLQLIPALVVLIPAFLGGSRAFRHGALPNRQAVLLAAVTIGIVALVTWTSGWQQARIERWSEGAMHGGMPWYRRLLPYLLLSWPTAWIMASKSKEINS